MTPECSEDSVRIRPVSFLWMGVLFASLLILDQLTKFLVVQEIRLHHRIPLIPSLLSLTHEKNTGGVFGLFQGQQHVLAVVSVLAFGLILYVLVCSLRASGRVTLSAAALTGILAGDVGNLLDRVFRPDGVVDFIHFHVGDVTRPLLEWFPFNVADSAITVGVILYLWASYRAGRKAGPCGNGE